MHELAVTQNLLKLALQHAEKAGAVRIKELNLVVGELASIVDDSVQFYWGMIAKGTIAEHAELNFTRLPARLACQDCGHEFPMDRERFTCPECGSKSVKVAGGDEFYLESIEVDLAHELQSDS